MEQNGTKSNYLERLGAGSEIAQNSNLGCLECLGGPGPKWSKIVLKLIIWNVWVAWRFRQPGRKLTPL